MPLPVLTPEQLQIQRTTNKHVQVLAYAGCGKTITLCARIEYLLKHNVAPHQILALGFSKTTVKILRRRLHNDIRVKTFHAFGQSLMKAKKNTVKLTTEGQRQKLLKAALKACPAEGKALRKIGTGST